MNVRKLRSLSPVLAIVLVLIGARSAEALQPLQEFLNSAKSANPDTQEAAANAVQQGALADVQLGRALPGINLRGTYTRNQYNAEFPVDAGVGMPGQPGYIAPEFLELQQYNQFDLYATLNVPLVDLGQFKRISAARRTAEQTEKQLLATQLQVSGQVAQAYYQLVANLALVAASQRQLEVAKQSLALSQDKYDLGAAPELDVDRAKAQSEQQVQQLASSNYNLALAKRSLYSASLLEPIIDTQSDFTGDLHQEPGLDEWVKLVNSVPTVQAAELARSSADATAASQKLALVPVLAGQFIEHLSNAQGFAGTDANYQLIVALTWNFDFTNLANIKAANAAVVAARARELRARLTAGDAINMDWNAVRAAIARSASARVEVAADKHAADLALDRYKAGSATQLDLLQAQRDAFNAEVARIQADADLANARAQLKLSVGQTLDDQASPTTSAPQEKGVQPK